MFRVVIPFCSLLAFVVSGCTTDARIARLERRVDSLAVAVAALANARQNANRPAAAAAPESATVALTGAGEAGEKSAPVVVVEFTDYQCPFCGWHFRQTLPELRRNYVSTGKVRYIIRDLPLSQVHPYAKNAAIATRCAAAQGREQYWRFHDALFHDQKNINDTLLPVIARRIGLDVPKFRDCFASPGTRRLVEGDLSEARRAGFNGTPTFVIGRPQSDGTVRGVLFRGAYPYEEYQHAIDAALGVTTARR